MKDKKEKLYDYLKKREYFESQEEVLTEAKDESKRSTKKISAKQKKKEWTDAVKRFQTFSGLKPTGRVNKATLQEIEMPRCGNPDVSVTSADSADSADSRWSTTVITYGFLNFTGQLSPQTVRDEIAAAFAVWRSAVNDFRFQEISTSGGPLIKFQFIPGAHGDGRDFRGRDGDVGHAFPPNSPVFRGVVHFDEDERWGIDRSPDKIDLRTVAIHEIGHALGLVAHSTNENAQMFARYRRPFRDLHQEDRDRIRALYRRS